MKLSDAINYTSIVFPAGARVEVRGVRYLRLQKVLDAKVQQRAGIWSCVKILRRI